MDNLQNLRGINKLLNSPNSRKQIAIDLSLLDLHNLSKTCKAMRHVVATIHNEAYLDLLRPYAGDMVDDFESTIIRSGAVIMGLGALSLILRPNSCHVNNLNVALPRGAVTELQHWLIHHDFDTQPLQMTSITPSMQHFINSHQTFYKRSTPNLEISLTESVDDTVLSVVLAGHSTAEMSYVTPGGIFCPHPRLTLDRVVCPAFLSNDEKMTQAEIERYTHMGLFPADYEDILRAKVSMAINPLLGGGRRGVLYATSHGCPILIPIPLMIDTHELTTTDHLFTEPWVNEFGRDAIMMQPAVYRNTFTTHPKNQTPLPFRLVVCHENHDRSRKNYLLSALGSDIAGFGNIFVPYGNILVLKTKTDDPTNIIDVNSSDIDLITDVVLSITRSQSRNRISMTKKKRMNAYSWVAMRSDTEQVTTRENWEKQQHTFQ
ncbi:hypothetical protein EV424DRAFT_1353359 [Suillus variegatus]|nr:hypothetical protein EV424DRAFT_1353359 [Suillus variegatus]